jgi:hypothetical protein
MAFSLPIISFGRGGPSDYLFPSNSIVTKNAGDAQTFGLAMAELARNGTYRESLGRAAFDTVKNLYSVEHSSRRFTNLLFDVLKQQERRERDGGEAVAAVFSSLPIPPPTLAFFVSTTADDSQGGIPHGNLTFSCDPRYGQTITAATAFCGHLDSDCIALTTSKFNNVCNSGLGDRGINSNKKSLRSIALSLEGDALSLVVDLQGGNESEIKLYVWQDRRSVAYNFCSSMMPKYQLASCTESIENALLALTSYHYGARHRNALRTAWLKDEERGLELF